MSTVTNILVNDKFWKLPTSIIFLDRETRDKDIYPKPAHIYLFIFLSHWYWIYSFLSLILNIVWVCMIPYMCITSVNVFWQICYYFQNLFQFMCNRKGHLQGKDTKYYGDGLSSMMTPPLAITLSHWFFLSFFLSNFLEKNCTALKEVLWLCDLPDHI